MCAWNSDGTIAWITELPATHPELSIDVDVSPKTVFAYARESRTAWLLDNETGASSARHDVPPEYGVWVPRLRMSPDGKKVIARAGTEAQLFSLPGLVHVAQLDGYANEQSVAFSADGRAQRSTATRSNSTTSRVRRASPPSSQSIRRTGCASRQVGG